MTDQSEAPREPSVSRNRPTTVRYQVLGLLTLAAAISYLARNAVGVAESTIREDVGLTLRQSGFFMGAFFWSYAILQVPGGWLAHRFGSRVALAAFAVGWSLATLVIGLAHGLWLLIIAQLLMGGAQAGIFPASCYSISHWISQARRTFACGMLTMGMQVGAIIASLLTGPLLMVIHWRGLFLLYSIPGLIWAALFWLRFRDRPQQDQSVNGAELRAIGVADDNHSDSDKTSFQKVQPTPWLRIFTNRSIWFLHGQQICRASGYMFFASWFPTFLQQTRGVSVADSGYLQAFVFLGTMAGCLCGGLLTDWIWQRSGSLRWSRSGVGSVFLMGCATLILSAWFVQSTTMAACLLSAGAFFAALAGPCAFAATIDIGGEHVPQVFGLMNMLGNFAAAACPILVAELFARTANWNLVLLVFAGIYVAGAACWAMVDPSHKVDIPDAAYTVRGPID
ncbi:MAG: MFS transporter [Pirellulaceae bacterium]